MLGPMCYCQNMYAAEGSWDAVKNVKMMMKAKGLQKVGGSSLIQPGGVESAKSTNDGLPHQRRLKVKTFCKEYICMPVRHFSKLKENRSMQIHECAHLQVIENCCWNTTLDGRYCGNSLQVELILQASIDEIKISEQ
ncbi:uncharacterized protein LOC115685383 [Syzygium oleosum]|uniref:uncharacterized protein LOC115685383 n=1 Tax=Syzygium oleosum TaxID=219896 RepID=UPI0024BA1FE4|nr:uncharacterized protein LOC115685383 [Syzygium oleosum]